MSFGHCPLFDLYRYPCRRSTCCFFFFNHLSEKKKKKWGASSVFELHEFRANAYVAEQQQQQTKKKNEHILNRIKAAKKKKEQFLLLLLCIDFHFFFLYRGSTSEVAHTSVKCRKGPKMKPGTDRCDQTNCSCCWSCVLVGVSGAELGDAKKPSGCFHLRALVFLTLGPKYASFLTSLFFSCLAPLNILFCLRTRGHASIRRKCFSVGWLLLSFFF